jgi:hypothetical protein
MGPAVVGGKTKPEATRSARVSAVTGTMRAIGDPVGDFDRFTALAAGKDARGVLV